MVQLVMINVMMKGYGVLEAVEGCDEVKEVAWAILG